MDHTMDDEVIWIKNSINNHPTSYLYGESLPFTSIDDTPVKLSGDHARTVWPEDYKFYSVEDIKHYSIPPTDPLFSGAVFSYNIGAEKDVFSELPSKLFSDAYNRQIASILKALRTEYRKRISMNPNIYSHNKFLYKIDENSVETIQMASSWTLGNALIYFSFEPDEEESSFGMVWNDNEKKNYESRSGNLFLNSNDEIIHETIDFLLRVFR